MSLKSTSTSPIDAHKTKTELLAELQELRAQIAVLKGVEANTGTSAALEESESRFRTLADNISQLAWMADEKGWIFWYNKRWFDYTGTTLEEMEGWGWRNVHHPDHVKRVVDKISHCFKTGEAWEDTFPLRGKDGNYRWFLSRAMPIRDGAGKVVRWFGTNTDITERKRTEEARRESEERLRLAQQVASIGTFEWNIRTGVDTWTPELEAMYGLPKGGFPGTEPAWEQLVYHEDRAEAVRRLSEAIDNGYFEGEWRVVWPDGTVRWLHGKGWVFKDNEGKPLKLIGINIDITGRKQAEVELENYRKHLEDQVRERTWKLEEANARLQADIAERKRAEEVLKKLQANLEKSQEIAHLGSWELDLRTNTLSWSDEAYRIFGLQPREFDATYEAFLEAIHPDDRAAVDAAYKGSIRDGRDSYEIEHRVVRRSTGEIRFVHEKCEHIRDQSGQIVRSVGMVHDITERKRAEETLRKSEEKYRHLVEMANEGIWMLDRENVTTFVNPGMARMLGYSPEEVVGRMPYDFLDDAYRVEVSNHLNNRHRGARDQYTCKYLRKDGTDLWAIVSGTPLYDGNGVYTGAMAMITDITERKRLEEKLAHVASFPERNPNPIMEIDETGAITYSNPAANRLFSDLIPMGVSHPILRGIEPDAFKKIGESELSREVQIKDTIFQQSIFYLPDQKAVRIYSKDITKQKRAEEALSESGARLNSIFRAAPTGIGVVVDRVITEANYKLCEMTGYTRDELLGKDARVLYPSDGDYEYVGREKYDQIKRQGTGTVETRWRRKDGSVIDIILSSTPMDPGNLRAGVTFTALDITGRKRAEEAVRAADVRFRSLVQNSMDIIRILDNRGRIIYESSSSEKILGYPPGLTLGKSPLEFVHPDDVELVRNALDEVYDSKNPGTPTEFRISKADGSYLEVESIGNNLIGVPGVDGIVITTRPITERKRAEEALKAAKMQADLFVDLMCHDISNMNQVGIGFLEMALEMLDLDEAGREMLLRPKSAFENSSKLIDNVRKLQKTRTGEYPDREMDVGEVLGKVRDDHSRQHGSNVTINYTMKAGYLVKANVLLYDLFANLVGNAIKHSKVRPIVDINVEPISEDGRDYYKVTIDDRGPGVPDELKAVIFDRKLTGNIKSKGSGIGLLMAKTLTRSYKGRIWVEDRIPGDPAKGARFVVLLPAKGTGYMTAP